MQRCEAALAVENTTFAKQLFAAAAMLVPDAYLPLLRLGTAHFDSGNYQAALGFYNDAYAKSNPKDVSILYGSALCHEALDDLPESLKTFGIIDEKLPKSSEVYKDVRFSMGQIRLKMWQGSISSDSPLYPSPQ
jgi:tetratricopeptide (TPR) repeat protein